MVIIQINKYYFPWRGAEVVMFELSKLLAEHGHHVVPFAMRHPSNVPTPYAHAFVSEVQTEKVSFGYQGLRTAARMFYSFEARKKLSGLVKTTKPDIAHLHNIYHQLSPSVLDALRVRRVPTVMTVHDYALIAPNYTLFDHGAICERGLKNSWDIVKHRCVKNSTAASILTASAFAFAKAFHFYERGIDHFIAPSVFMKEMLVSHGFLEKKITVIPHFIDVRGSVPSWEGEYVGYMGQLYAEKGVDVLVRAAARVPDIPVKIAGSGPDEARLRALADALGARNVEFVGRLGGVARDRFYRHALMLVVPSVFYEIFGRIVLEAYAFGKPVIASHLGALPEVVYDAKTGYLFKAGDDGELAERIKALVNDPEKRREFGARGRLYAETEYAPERHYERIMEIYRGV